MPTPLHIPRDHSTLPGLMALMSGTLESHGDKPSWLLDTIDGLADGYNEERYELDRALDDYLDVLARLRRVYDDRDPISADALRLLERRVVSLRRRVIEECVDLANRLYFIVDKLELREEKDGTSRRTNPGGSQGPDAEASPGASGAHQGPDAGEA